MIYSNTIKWFVIIIGIIILLASFDIYKKTTDPYSKMDGVFIAIYHDDIKSYEELENIIKTHFISKKFSLGLEHVDEDVDAGSEAVRGKYKKIVFFSPSEDKENYGYFVYYKFHRGDIDLRFYSNSNLHISLSKEVESILKQNKYKYSVLQRINN